MAPRFQQRQGTCAQHGRQGLGSKVEIQDDVGRRVFQCPKADEPKARIPVAAIHEIKDTHPRIKDAMWHDTLVGGSIYREWVANVGRSDAHARIAHLLCEFALKLDAVSPGEQLDYTLPLTQDELADATGLTPVHVNRTLMDLARQGLIERVTPRSIVIGDWKRLAEAGDFDPAYLHLGPPKRSSGTH